MISMIVLLPKKGRYSEKRERVIEWQSCIYNGLCEISYYYVFCIETSDEN